MVTILYTPPTHEVIKEDGKIKIVKKSSKSSNKDTNKIKSTRVIRDEKTGEKIRVITYENGKEIYQSKSDEKADWKSSDKEKFEKAEKSFKANETVKSERVITQPDGTKVKQVVYESGRKEYVFKTKDSQNWEQTDEGSWKKVEVAQEQKKPIWTGGALSSSQVLGAQAYLEQEGYKRFGDRGYQDPFAQQSVMLRDETPEGVKLSRSDRRRAIDTVQESYQKQVVSMYDFTSESRIPFKSIQATPKQPSVQDTGIPSYREALIMGAVTDTLTKPKTKYEKAEEWVSERTTRKWMLTTAEQRAKGREEYVSMTVGISQQPAGKFVRWMLRQPTEAEEVRKQSYIDWDRAPETFVGGVGIGMYETVREKPLKTAGLVGLGFAFGYGIPALASAGTVGAVGVKLGTGAGLGWFAGATASKVILTPTKAGKGYVVGETLVEVGAFTVGAGLGSVAYKKFPVTIEYEKYEIGLKGEGKITMRKVGLAYKTKSLVGAGKVRVEPVVTNVRTGEIVTTENLPFSAKPYSIYGGSIGQTTTYLSKTGSFSRIAFTELAGSTAQPLTATAGVTTRALLGYTPEETFRVTKMAQVSYELLGERGLPVEQFVVNVKGVKNPLFVSRALQAYWGEDAVLFGSIISKTLPKGLEITKPRLPKEVFFHSTSAENIPKIMKEGIIPQKWAGGDITWLSKDLEVSRTGGGKTLKVTLTPSQLKEAMMTKDFRYETVISTRIKPSQIEVYEPQFKPYTIKYIKDPYSGKALQLKGFQQEVLGDVDVLIPKLKVAEIKPRVAEFTQILKAGKMKLPSGDWLYAETGIGENVRVSPKGKGTIIEFPPQKGVAQGKKFFEFKSGIDQATAELGDEAPSGFLGVKFANIKAGQSGDTVAFGEMRGIFAGEQLARKGAGATIMSSGMAGETESFSEAGILGKQGNVRGLKDAAGFFQFGTGTLEIVKGSFGKFKVPKLESDIKGIFETYSKPQRADILAKLKDITASGEPVKIPLSFPKEPKFEFPSVSMFGITSPSVSRGSLVSPTITPDVGSLFEPPSPSSYRIPSPRVVSPSLYTIPSPSKLTSPSTYRIPSPSRSPSPYRITSPSPSKFPSPSEFPSPSSFPSPSDFPSPSPPSPSTYRIPSPSPSPFPSPSRSPSPSPSPYSYYTPPETKYPLGFSFQTGVEPKRKKRKGKKRKYEYMPDLTSLMLGITKDVDKGLTLSGLELRPIPIKI